MWQTERDSNVRVLVSHAFERHHGAQRFFRTLRKNWLLVLALTLLGLASATGFTATRTPTYESSSTVFVSTQAGGTALELQQGSTFAQARINTYVGLVTAPIVLDPVIAQLRLAETTETLAAKVKASATLNTTLITVTVVETDPALSAEISNSIAKTLATVVPQLEPASVDGASPIRLTLVREASVPTTPSSPNMLLNLALGAVVGLLAGVAGAFLRSSLDTRVRAPRDAESITGAPAIGAIAYDPKAKERPLIVHADPLSPRAESSAP